MTRVVVFLTLIHASYSIWGQNFKTVDSLMTVLPRTKDTTRVYVLYDLFIEYCRTDTEKAYSLINEAISEAFKSGDSLAIAKTHYGRGWLARLNEEFKMAIPDYELALAISQRNGFKRWVMYILNDLALMHQKMANYDLALNYNFQSLEIRNKLGSPVEISIALNNVGLVYLSMNDFENGLRYFQDSYDVKVKNDIKYDADLCLINIGVCYNGLFQYAKAVLFQPSSWHLLRSVFKTKTFYFIQWIRGSLYRAS